MNDKANKSIEYTVTECKNHCQNEKYCSLNTFKVGTHEVNPTMCECTDCKSFECKTNCGCAATSQSTSIF